MNVPQIGLKRLDLRRHGIDVGEPRRTPAHPLGEPPRDAGFGGAVQDFQHGTIYWHANTGAHYLRGSVLQRYLELHGPGVEALTYRRPLGFPTSDLTHDEQRKLDHADFEFGSIYAFAEGGGFDIHQALAARFPKLAKPNFVGPAGERLALDDLSWAPNLPPPSKERLETIRALWRRRLGLQSVVDQAEIVDLEVAITQVAKPLPGGKQVFVYHQGAEVPTGRRLRDRTLYNVVMRSPQGEVLNVAPHAYYCRSNWDRFGILHVTDTHVSKRLDVLQVELAGYTHVATQHVFDNFNDNFRNLLRYANKLHRKGQLDLIIHTGDLVDYQFEPDDSRGGGGNFELLERLLLGQAPSPTGVPTEELGVPLCATLGNHDYRTDRYALNFEVGVPHLRHEVSSFFPMNLTKEEALFLQHDGSTPVLSRDSAGQMVKFGAPTYALRRLCGDEGAAEASFVLRLGRHRVVLLDSKHDLGVVDDILGVLGAKLNGSEDERSFLGGSPNLVGVSDQHLEFVRDALRDAGDEGVVIVGIHAPCINPAGNDFAHFLRETEHATVSEVDIKDYLFRHRGRGTGPPAGTEAFAAATGQPFFSRGPNDFLDRDGVSKGKLDDFLTLAAGGPGPGGQRLRPMDLVLCGHGHYRTEFRVAWDDEVNGWRFFTEFYTGNPGRYYCTRMSSVDAGKERIHVWVLKGARANGPAVRRTDDHPYLALDVPPYSQPLDDAADKGQWWKDHRPVFLQTAALGPIETVGNTREPTNISERPDPNFYGFRFLTVAGSSIDSIDYARFPEVRQNALAMPWELSTVVTYDKTKGIGEIYVAQANGKLRLLRHYDDWPKSLTQVFRGDFGGRGLIDLLFYNPQTHTGEFWEISADGSMRLLARNQSWRPSWVRIVPGHFRMGGTTDLIFYEAKGGDHEVWGTGEGGAMTLLSHGKSGGESHVVPLNCNNGLFTDLLTYDADRGLGVLSSPGNDISGAEGGLSGLRPNWTHIVPGRFGGHGFSDLLFYQASTGTAELWAVRGRVEINLIRSHSGLPQDWSHIVAGNFGGGRQSDVLFYSASRRTAEIHSCDGNGGLRLINTIPNWGPWTHVFA
jgi:hypothetical protein